MVLPFLPPFSGWAAVTTLGQSQTLLPAAFVFGAWLGWRPQTRTFALGWLAALALAVLLVSASKVAFIGWGIGSAALDFTGVSGHAMCAAAVYPLVFALVFGRLGAAWRWAGVAFGMALALLIAVSRLEVHAHSVSEVVTGCAVGAAVSWWALREGSLVRVRTPLLLLLVFGLWMLPRWVPAEAVTVESPPQDVLTWLALEASGHDRPYTRTDLRRRRTPRSEPLALRARDGRDG